MLEIGQFLVLELMALCTCSNYDKWVLLHWTIAVSHAHYFLKSYNLILQVVLIFQNYLSNFAGDI